MREIIKYPIVHLRGTNGRTRCGHLSSPSTKTTLEAMETTCGNCLSRMFVGDELDLFKMTRHLVNTILAKDPDGILNGYASYCKDTINKYFEVGKK